MLNLLPIVVAAIILSSPKVNADTDSKIVGGFEVLLKNAPFATSLQYRGNHFCGGALVTLSHVLTGCHCMAHVRRGLSHEAITLKRINELTAVFGAENIIAPESSSYFQLRNIENRKIHPRCAYEKILVYDFALVFLDKPVLESVNVRPFKMHSHNQDEYDQKTKSLVGNAKFHCYVVGWGSTDPIVHKANPVLKGARMRVISDAECRRLLSRENDKFDMFDFAENAMICTLSVGEKKNESDCVGDSGGPFFCGSTVYGVVSFGYDCGRWDVPNVYAKVSFAVKWLKSLGLFTSTRRPRQRLQGQQIEEGLMGNNVHRADSQFFNTITLFGLVVSCSSSQ